MSKFDLHKTKGVNNVMNAIQQVKSVNNIIPLTEAKELLIENIYSSVENFYSIEELDKLSESIQELGILQPLLVSERAGGTYEIIAGNRRYEAAKIIGLERLPCVVKQNVEPNLFKIMLIHANMFRVKTDIERATEVAELKKAILALKSADKSIKGRTSEIAGQILNLSYRQVNRLDNLNKLIPEIKELVQSERLTASGAEQFANLSEDVQKEIYEALINSGMDINNREAVQLRKAFLAKHREFEKQSEADMEDLREKIAAEQAKLLEKEQELERLTNHLNQMLYLNEMKGQGGDENSSAGGYNEMSDGFRDQGGALTTNAEQEASNNKELEKVKQALVAALQDRKMMEERYKQLSQILENQPGDLLLKTREPSVTDSEKLINDVKRRVQLQECIGQLKLVSRLYTEYRNLYQSAAPLNPSANEVNLLEELSRIVKELSVAIAKED